MQCQGGRSMFNLISLQCIGLPWNTEWKISKPEKGTCKGLFHKQAVKSRTLILKSQELLAFSVNTCSYTIYAHSFINLRNTLKILFASISR